MSESGDGSLSAAAFAQVVAEIELEEFERASQVAPIFLWLWEHREEVRGLHAAGASWSAIAAALARIGLTERTGVGPSPEHCRAAWARVLAYEPLVAGRSLLKSRTLPDFSAVEVQVRPASPVSAHAPMSGDVAEGDQKASGAGTALSRMLLRRRRTALEEPSPLTVGSYSRRSGAGREGEGQ